LTVERAFGTVAAMGRTRVRYRRLAATLALAAVASAWAPAAVGALSSDGATPVARQRYLIRSGDTLWSIALRISPGEDPRPLVDAISSANAIDAESLVPGQTLVIPSAG
jgi:nucleoid-associated protein YgaU